MSAESCHARRTDCRPRRFRRSTASPAACIAASSSAGVTNLSQRWVPRGSQRSTYSAPTMASAKLFMVRLSVAAIIMPPGLHHLGAAPHEQRHVGDMLDHLHRQHHVEALARVGQRLGGGGAIIDPQVGLRGMPARDLDIGFGRVGARPRWRRAAPAARTECRRRSRYRGCAGRTGSRAAWGRGRNASPPGRGYSRAAPG